MKNSQKGFLVPLLIAIIGLLVLGGSTYIYLEYVKLAPRSQSNDADTIITDALAYYKLNKKLSTGDNISRIVVDLNGDGYKDTLISNSTADSGNSQDENKNYWHVFINNENKNYSIPTSSDTSNDLNQTIIFLRPDAVGYDIIPGETTKSLITYMRNSASDGSLIWYKIVNNKIEVKNKTIEPQGKDQVLYNQLIENPSSKVIIEDIRI